MISVSPLFAVQAEQLILEGHPSEAIELCLDGLEYYTDYPTAYIVAARAYLVLDDETKALHILDRALSLFPLHKPLRHFYEDLISPFKGKEEEFDTTDFDSKISDLDFDFGVPESENNVSSQIETYSEVSPEISGLHNFIQEQNEPVELEIDSLTLQNEDSLELQNEVSEPSNEDIELELSVRETEPILSTFNLPTLEPKTVTTESEPITLETNPDISEHNTEDIKPVDSEPAITGTDKDTETKTNEVSNSESENKVSIPDETNQTPVNLKRFSPLRIIETVKAPPYFIGSIKSSSINMISGLEFAPLRVENGQANNSSLETLSEPPSFPKFLRKSKVQSTQAKPEETNQADAELLQKRRTPLEELAARLEKVRIPVTHQENVKSSTPSQIDPTMVTETMAMIYEKQGAYSEAIKAYQILARRTPEKLNFYEQKIREVMKLIT